MYTFARIEGSNPSLTAKIYSDHVRRNTKRLKSKGFKLFLLPYAFQEILLNPEIVGGITRSKIRYPYFCYPQLSTVTAEMVQRATSKDIYLKIQFKFLNDF